MRTGWSSEVRPNTWVKVNLDDLDLLRILVAAGLGTIAPEQVPTVVAFQLLDNECERLVLAKLMTSYDYPKEQGRARLGELTVAKNKLLDGLAALTAQGTPPSAHGDGAR